jgi:multidrug efflux system membrane fusion protein
MPSIRHRSKAAGTARLRIRRARHAWWAALLLAFAAFGAACSSPSDAERGTAQAPAVPVRVAPVERADVPQQIRAIGTVRPYSTVAVKSQVEGQLAEIHFEEGQSVRRGDLLFTIDPRPFEADLRQAQANLSRDKAEMDNAEVEAGRTARLFAKGFASKEENDAAQTRVSSLRAAVAADQAAVESAKLRLDYCYIHSPLDGRIGEQLVHRGNVVKSNDTTLAVINELRPIYVEFSVPERDLPEIQRRAAAGSLSVTADSAGIAPQSGRLTFIDNAVDATTGTIRLKARFANPDEVLWPGQFVDVTLQLSVQKGAVVAPAEALQTGQSGQYVFVVQADDTVRDRPVEVEKTVGQRAVIASGLQPGEVVVTDGQLRLAPGMHVQVVPRGGATTGGGRATPPGSAS